MSETALDEAGLDKVGFDPLGEGFLAGDPDLEKTTRSCLPDVAISWTPQSRENHGSHGPLVHASSSPQR